ncbi:MULTISPECIES: flagellar motor switch protein FliN [Oceanospirillaceae]|jgi:flagellar motor switch protein FliN/FliY|uniref:flagellar motor switch protein FliN n=1 Tax=Oceanospirillaceae TaxID=135620 RepID=UPI000C5AC090|nr:MULTISPECIES: flagellar motor switch protein FliN [Thalassolituus]MAY14428.1 flagellar motor switch protein FliN [Oceanospirillaceae bacterium]MBU2038834.1 flagellar motor switch protein FliN [Gammaproteobacteria bacterium]MCA6061932.1 flagellar motor switch protein FliN [Thalassolituus sp. ST750PaO-4]MCB2385301.1 flagellar motor switch protein FliN [Thalassolituus alkanivorans]MCB2421842.1 flagellar motor switch protein FliN [Thalassolituus alkanivorans]
MSDDNEKDLPEEESSELDADALANEVAAGVSDAGDDEEALADEWAAAMEEAGELDGDDGADAASDIRQVELDELHDDSKPGDNNGIGPELDVILDIPVRISMEVGATQIPIRNLLQLNQGSVVELDRLAGEPLDVMVNGTLIAHGEVVMVNDKFGIRLTDVVSQSERIQRLR